MQLETSSCIMTQSNLKSQQLDTHAAAERHAVDILYNRARDAGIHRFWKSGKGKGPRVTFTLPKNKMQEENGEFKARILFSYYGHPLGYYGRLVGRCLTLMLKIWKALVPGLEILNTTCLLRLFRRWNQWLQEGNDPQSDPLQLWRLDVKEMFPSMDGERVYEALLKFHEILVKRRGKRGKELLFAINRFDRKLDRLGTGYGKYFTNLSFSDVAAFCTYDIYQNDLFVFCNRVMRQKWGLAIGGTGSAQLASITLSVAEELYYPCITPVPLDSIGHHPCDLPVHLARFRDNIIGLKGAETPVADIQANLEAVYALNLKVENEGDIVKTLEGMLSLEYHNVRPYIRISRPPRTDTAAPIERTKL